MRQKVHKNAAINRKYIDDRRFQYAFELIQHHKEIKDHSERVSNIKPLFNLYSWVVIDIRHA